VLKRVALGLVLAVIVLFVAIQFVPYGHNHTNPPVQAEPKWDSLQTRELAERACFDCHSNQTVWPWYSNIAPVSWLIQRDVDQGRRRLNFSEWHTTQRGAREASRIIQRGEMPQWYYVLLHPAAKLSPQDSQVLSKGLGASLALQLQQFFGE
jgi:hypothetical protein